MSSDYMMIVNFEKCKTCKYEKDSEQTTRCDECLSVAARPNSHTPIHYEPKG